MDPNTGKLRSLSSDEFNLLSKMEKGQNLSSEEEKKTKALKGLELVPENLIEEAKHELGEKKETYVNLSSESKLVQRAKRQRKNRKKIKRKMAKKSRKINRKN